MSRKRFSVEQIISHLREAEVRLAQCRTVGDVCREIGVSEQSYYRSRKTFMNLGMKQPEICFTMLGTISRHLHQMVAEVEQLKTRNGEQRLANFLAGLCGKASGPCEISLPYDKGLVAARLGMQPRHLANLSGLGVRSNGHTVSIASVERLLEFSEVAPLRRERSA